MSGDPLSDQMKSAFAWLTREGIIQGGPSSFTVRGGSMRPFLRKGMRVHLEPVDPAGIRVGDIVGFALDGGLVAHRVIALDGSGNAPGVLRTKGDACAYADPPVRHEDVVGRVHRVETASGTIDLGTARWRAVGLVLARVSRAAAAARAGLRSLLVR